MNTEINTSRENALVDALVKDDVLGVDLALVEDHELPVGPDRLLAVAEHAVEVARSDLLGGMRNGKFKRKWDWKFKN